VLENNWLRYWSGSALGGDQKSASHYIAVYAAITTAGVVVSIFRWFVLYDGSIRASIALYKRLLETIMFANIRFHDTVSCGRVLNRFGKDFEVIDSGLADDFGHSIIYGLSVLATLVTVSFVGALPFIVATGVVYYKAALT